MNTLKITKGTFLKLGLVKPLKTSASKRTLIIAFLCFFQTITYGQNYSLKQCIDFATVNNSNIKIAEFEVQNADSKTKEQLGSYLPQINGAVNYTDNLKMATSLIPGSFLGQPEGSYYEVEMGTQHNLSTGISLNQKIFDPQFNSVLKEAKINQDLAEQAVQQTQEQVVYKISKTYYQALIIQKQTHVLNATMQASEKSLMLTENKYQNGIAKKIDVDKIKVSTNNTRTQLQQSELNYNQTINALKFYMGISFDSLLVLTDTTLETTINVSELYSFGNYNIENKIDYRMQQTNLLMQEVDKSRTMAGYMPTLSLSGAYNYNAMGNQFNFFGSDGKWYNSSNIGLSLKVPIFDGLQRHQKISQSKINIAIAQENLKLTEQSLLVNLSNYEIQYRNALDNIRDQKLNLELAQSVYNDTYSQYQQGLGTSLDLVQAESSLRETQNNYFNKLLNLYIARLDLELSKGTLIEFINTQN